MFKSIPPLANVQVLNGRIFAMLTPEEISVLEFYRSQGRKFDVVVNIINEADSSDLAAACSQEVADSIMKQANSRVSVAIDPNAESLWHRAYTMMRM